MGNFLCVEKKMISIRLRVFSLGVCGLREKEYGRIYCYF